MSQADPSRHIDASLHGSRPEVQETTSPDSELQGADAGAMPSRGRRGGVVEKDTDCVNKDPEINVGSPEMGGSRDELEELTQLMRDAEAEDFVDTLLKQDIRCTRDLADFSMGDLHEYLRIPLGTAMRMIKMAQAAPQEPSPPRSAIRRSQSVSEQAERGG